jgi:hypothetical protein
MDSKETRDWIRGGMAAHRVCQGRKQRVEAFEKACSDSNQMD